MPRPSDVYATLGAPGLYQSTPWTPYQLPNVYVFPPEEDNQDVFCLFHSGLATPTPYESFFGHKAFIQGGPNTPPRTDTLDEALSHIPSRPSSHSHSPRRSTGESWEHVARPTHNYPSSSASSASSQSSSSDSAHGHPAIEPPSSPYSDAICLVQNNEQLTQREPLSRSISRRSSIFGDRPPDYDSEAVETSARDENQSEAPSKAQTMTIRSRAAIAFKVFTSARSRRPDCQTAGADVDLGPAIYESWFEPEPPQKKRNRKTLSQLFGSNHNHNASDARNSHFGESELVGSLQPTKDLKLNKRKSMTFFGLARSSMDNLTTREATPPLAAGPTTASSPDSLGPSTRDLKLSRRKSMSQLFGLGRNNDSSIGKSGSHLEEAGGNQSPVTIAFKTHLKGLTIHPSVSKAAVHQTASIESPVSPTTSSKTTFISRRRSFLGGSFSFLDSQRRFRAPSDPHPVLQHAQSESAIPRIPSAAHTLIDSDPATEEEPLTPDSLVGVHISTLVHGNDAKDITLDLLSDAPLDLNANVDFSEPFGLHTADDDADRETVGTDELSTLGLAMRLESLTFEQLVFDASSFPAGTYR
ncbi:hypothetical protein K439DRAFT_1612243 [Ramaria rubella]|nr:hypothetical protein K439DRAFT_1612243 [Ramaria rubella]